MEKMDKLEASQRCFLGFLQEFLIYVEKQEFVKAIKLLKEEISTVEQNQIHDFDKEILNRLNMLADKFTNSNLKEYIELIKKEIDIISKDISISK